MKKTHRYISINIGREKGNISSQPVLQEIKTIYLDVLELETSLDRMLWSHQSHFLKTHILHPFLISSLISISCFLCLLNSSF